MFAVQLALLYQILGYDSYQLNINVHGNTHAITIVRTENYGWQVEDACFNYTVNDLSGLRRLEGVVGKKLGFLLSDTSKVCGT